MIYLSGISSFGSATKSYMPKRVSCHSWPHLGPYWYARDLSGPCVVLSNYCLGDFSSNSSGHASVVLRGIFYPKYYKRNASGLLFPLRHVPSCWKTPQTSIWCLPLPWGNCAPKELWRLEGDKYLWWFGHWLTFKNSLLGVFVYFYRNPNMARVSPTFTGMFLCHHHACTDTRPLDLQTGWAFNATAWWNTWVIFGTSLQNNYAVEINFSIVSLACVLSSLMLVSFNGSFGSMVSLIVLPAIAFCTIAGDQWMSPCWWWGFLRWFRWW